MAKSKMPVLDWEAVRQELRRHGFPEDLGIKMAKSMVRLDCRQKKLETMAGETSPDLALRRWKQLLCESTSRFPPEILAALRAAGYTK